MYLYFHVFMIHANGNQFYKSDTFMKRLEAGVIIYFVEFFPPSHEMKSNIHLEFDIEISLILNKK